jgi:hypothetical protein
MKRNLTRLEIVLILLLLAVAVSHFVCWAALHSASEANKYINSLLDKAESASVGAQIWRAEHGVHEPDVGRRIGEDFWRALMMERKQLDEEWKRLAKERATGKRP